MRITLPAGTLRILRESMRLSREELTEKTGISIQDLKRLEEKGGEISYKELIRLARILEYPLAVFLLTPENLPNIKTPEDKRTLPTAQHITFETMRHVKRARIIQDYLTEAYPPYPLPKRFTTRTPPWEAARAYRALFTITTDTLSAFKTPGEALASLRTLLFHKLRIYTLQLPLPLEEVRGLVLLEKGKTPIIIINSHDTDEAKLFTLFHELGHIILGETASFFDYPTPIEEPSRIEAWCNAFAASILLPKEDLEAYLSTLPANEQGAARLIKRLSTHFNVSKTFILIQLVKLGKLPQDVLEQHVKKHFTPARTRKKQRGGPSFSRRLVSQLGEPYINRVITDYQEKTIPLDRALELLAVKRATFEKLVQGVTA